jgi:hypothetical protein
MTQETFIISHFAINDRLFITLNRAELPFVHPRVNWEPVICDISPGVRLTRTGGGAWAAKTIHRTERDINNRIY